MAIPQRALGSLTGLNVSVEVTRRWLAWIALWSYLLLIAAVVLIGWVWQRIQIDEVLKVVTTIAGVLGGVIGAIIGFYFRDTKQ